MSVARSVLATSLLALLFAGCNDSQLGAMPGSLSASPSAIDYGLVKENTVFSQTVILSHKGNNEVRITGFRFEPADAPFRFDDDVELPTEAAPWILRGEDFRGLDVSFAPVINGERTGALVIESNDSDNPELWVDLVGHGFHTTLDDFEQGGIVGGKADILFIVDNSGSMGDKQTKLGQSFQTFIGWLTGGLVDFRIAITTTDMDATGAQGAFVGTPKILDNTTPGLVAAFQANVNVGTGGSGNEQGLGASEAALSPAMLAGANANFLRSDARLYVVYVSDEEDSSPSSPSQVQSSITAAKGGDASQVFFAAIAGPEPIGCFTFAGSADAGARYIDVVDASSGLFGSICDADFGVTLQNLAFEVTAAGNNFPLTELPKIDSILVLVAGIPQATTTWMYSATSNSVQFVPGYEPDGGDVVTITYDVL